MSEFHRLAGEREGRRGSTIDSDEGGGYLGIPPKPSHRPHHPVSYHQPGVHEIRGGTGNSVEKSNMPGLGM
jgi:hypothetical protein